MTTALPQTTTTLYLLLDGTYSADPGSNGQAVTVPVTDLVWTDDLDPSGAETKNDLQVLAQDLYHVLGQLLGSNPDDLASGVGIEGLLSSSVPDFLAAANTIDRQFELDDRVTQSSTEITGSVLEGFTISTEVVASGSVLPMQTSYSTSAGLRLLGTT